MPARTVHLSLGANLGDREKQLQQALQLIGARAGEVKRVSSFYETAAWGNEAQPDFLNIAAELHTDLSPENLLRTLLGIEKSMGRRREEKWGPRTIDIDILLCGKKIIAQHGLHIPHPQLHLRRFVLEPLAEIAAGEIHPALQKTIAQLLAECPDALPVKRLAAWKNP